MGVHLGINVLHDVGVAVVADNGEAPIYEQNLPVVRKMFILSITSSAKHRWIYLIRIHNLANRI